MSGITNPAEVYFKNGLWAWDPFTNSWRKLETTSGAHTLEVKLGASAEVHQDTPADLVVGTHGWDGSAWRKLPMLFGYSDRWTELASGQADGAGNAVASSEAVDEGYVYVLQSLAVYHSATAAKQVYVEFITTGDDMIIFDDLAAAPLVYHTVQCECVLKYQDYVKATAVAPGDDKWVYLKLWGYKMKIAE